VTLSKPSKWLRRQNYCENQLRVQRRANTRRRCETHLMLLINGWLSPCGSNVDIQVNDMTTTVTSPANEPILIKLATLPRDQFNLWHPRTLLETNSTWQLLLLCHHPAHQGGLFSPVLTSPDIDITSTLNTAPCFSLHINNVACLSKLCALHQLATDLYQFNYLLQLRVKVLLYTCGAIPIVSTLGYNFDTVVNCRDEGKLWYHFLALFNLHATCP